MKNRSLLRNWKWFWIKSIQLCFFFTMWKEVGIVIINRYFIYMKIKKKFHNHHLPFYFLWRFFTVLNSIILHVVYKFIKDIIWYACNYWMYQSIHYCMLCISMSYFFIKFSLPPKKLTRKMEKRQTQKRISNIKYKMFK